VPARSQHTDTRSRRGACTTPAQASPLWLPVAIQHFQRPRLHLHAHQRQLCRHPPSCMWWLGISSKGVWGHLGHGAALLLVFGASVVWDAGVEAAMHCGGWGDGWAVWVTGVGAWGCSAGQPMRGSRMHQCCVTRWTCPHHQLRHDVPGMQQVLLLLAPHCSCEVAGQVQSVWVPTGICRPCSCTHSTQHTMWHSTEAPCMPGLPCDAQLPRACRAQASLSAWLGDR